MGTPNTSVPVAQVITLKGVPKVNVKVCVDVRGVNVVDRQGKSVVDPARGDTYLVEMVVVNAKYPSATNWRISDASSRERKCVA